MPDVDAAAEQATPAASEPRPEGILGRTYRMLTLGIVTVVLLIAFEAMAVGTAMPAAARDLNGVGLYAYAFSAYFTTALAAMVISGQWSDRSGPLRPLAAGITSFAVGLVLAGSAQTMWVFIAGRAVQGLGGGLVIVALYVVVSRAFPERLRPSILAAFAASWVVPSIVGPLAAGTVTEHLGWRWVFLGIPPLVLLPVLVALPAIRRRAAGPVDPAKVAPLDRRRIGLAGAIAVGAGLLQYAGQDVRWLSAIPAVAGAALLVPAVRVLLPRGTYAAARGLPTVVLMRGIAAGSFIAAESFVPLMLVTQRGLSVTAAGMALAVGGATWALGSWTQARPRLERHRERLVRTGMLLTASAIASAALILNDGVPVWLIGVAWAIGCYGMGMVISGTSVLLLKLSPPEEAGANSAALQLSDSLANVVLLAVAGVIFASLGGAGIGHGSLDGASSSHPAAFVAIFLPMAAVALVGAAVAGRLRPAVSR
ncbi:MFS transporter [Streptomyces boninensis]|uniref:MFS transporter n=1 Tax=Streptomyces boninensis TaxID=2039455 RepID=UPI003B218AFB